MKKNLLFIISFFAVTSLLAQNKSGLLKGRLIDSTNKQILQNATISVLDNKDSVLQLFGVAKPDGSFEIKNIPDGDYIVMISFQGFQPEYRNISFDKDINLIDLKTIYLKVVGKDLGNVTVKAPPVVIKGDTTEFTADMFKTKPNASAEDLLKKLPGVQVEKDGTVKAQGENVKRVLVDGKKFFGDDPKTATRNLPTDVIDKIQVYDAQSDQSAFSGFDDGNRDKTINIITKKDRRKGYFGKISVGAGDKERYNNSISLNRFNGNQRLSLIGQGNNINAQNFSIQDILGVMGGGGSGGGRSGGMFSGGAAAALLGGSQSGITTTWAGGLNYSDVWSKKIQVSGSYFYNNLKVSNAQDRYRETFVLNDSSLFNNNNYDSYNKNYNHRFNFEFDYRIDSVNSLLIRPTFSSQESNNFNETFTQTIKGKGTYLNDVNQKVSSQNTGYNFNNSILFRHRFAKRGRTISFNFTQALNNSETNSDNISYNTYFGGAGAFKDTIDQKGLTSRDGKTFGANISYTEPIGTKGQLEINYNYNDNETTSNQETNRYNKATGKYDINVSTLTNNFENSNTSHRVGANYRQQLNKELSLNFGLSVQQVELESINRSKNTDLSQTFNNFVPTFSIQYSKNRARNLRFNYRGRTNQPGLTQLQPVIDNSNLLNITAGNPALKQEFSHNINISYNTFDVFTFKNFIVSINGGLTQNKISNAVTLNTGRTPILVDGIVLNSGAQYSKPVNIDGAYNLFSFINYGFPVLKKLKANLNLTTTLNYNKNINLLNDVKNISNNYIINERIMLTMNLKERFDLNLSTSSTFNIVRYSQQPQQNGDYFTQNFSIEPTYSTKNGWIFGSDFDYTFNKGQAEGFNQSIPLLGASIAKTMFKKKDGELKFSVFDLLNQNKSINRTVAANYIEDSRTQVLNRYFMLTFTWNMRNFAGQGKGMPGIMNMFKGATRNMNFKIN